jgi:hypothetical protein
MRAALKSDLEVVGEAGDATEPNPLARILRPAQGLDGRRDARHGRDLDHRRVTPGRPAQRGSDLHPLRRRRDEGAVPGSVKHLLCHLHPSGGRR